MKPLLSAILILFCFQIGITQDFDPRSRRPGVGDASGNPNQQNNRPDSIRLNYFYLDKIDENIAFKDTILDLFFPMYDPSRRSWKEWFNLGNTGSASTPMLYEKHIPLGTNYGFDSYRSYQMTIDSFKFYDVNLPLLNFYFTPVGGQQNFVIKTDFARSFRDGVKLSLNYNRINQEGFYLRQNLKHTNLGMSLWWHPQSGNQDFFFTFINSVQSEDHNGGVQDRASLTGDFGRLRMSIPVNLTEAASRFQHRTYHFQHHFRLVDSTGQSKGLELISSLSLNNGYYKYSDGAATSNFYEEFLIDDRGLRNYIGYFRTELKSQLKGSLSNGISGKAGIHYLIHRLNYEARKETRNDLFAVASANIPVGRKWSIDGQARVGLGNSGGDFLVSGRTDFKIGKGSALFAEATFFRHQHPLQVQSLYLNEQLIWENDFQRPFGSFIRAQLSLPILDARLGAQQILENNTLYYDENIQPQTLDGVFTASQADLYFNLSWWKLSLHNLVAYQTFNENLFHLPNLYYKYNFFYSAAPFSGRLRLRLGAEGKIVGPYDRIEFFPLLSVFYQGTGNTRYEPYADLYLAGQIKSFRFFLRYENLGDLIQERLYYHVGDYPQYDRKLRLGISWYFVD